MTVTTAAAVSRVSPPSFVFRSLGSIVRGILEWKSVSGTQVSIYKFRSSLYTAEAVSFGPKKHCVEKALRRVSARFFCPPLEAGS